MALDISQVIFNKFAAAKARKLCLWSWKITSKALQAVPAKMLLLGVMQAAKNYVASLDFAAEIWYCCCALSLCFWAPDFIFTPTLYIYVAHIRISLSKLQYVPHNQHYKGPEPSPESFQWRGLDILKFHKVSTDL